MLVHVVSSAISGHDLSDHSNVGYYSYTDSYP